MRNSFKLIAILLMIVFAFFLACETEEDEEEVHPLVGTWDMTNMEQTAVIKTTEQWGPYPADYALVDTTLTWAFFHDYLGVWATIYINDDGTFTLNGQFPASSDTLGVSPALLDSLTDTGIWTAAEDLSTLSIDGMLYDLGGVLTVDDLDNPTVISLYYTEYVVDSLYVPAMGTYFLIALSDSSATTLGFTKQQ